MITIEVTARTVYGNTQFYPGNAAALQLAKIARTVTLTANTLQAARDMGCEIVLDGDKTLLQFAA